jgi:DNA-binding transcriptional ArsR family regulator
MREMVLLEEKMNLQLQQFKADFFKALSHPMRIRILELLAEGDKNVNELLTIIGAEGSTVSQQLSVLRSKNIVTGTKDGNRVLYSLRDPMIIDLLDIVRQIFNNHLIDTANLLDKFNEDLVKEMRERN